MIKALIFDLDGTVIDNEGQWEEAFRKVLTGNSKKKIGDEEWIHEPGIGLEANWNTFKKRYEINEETEKLCAQTAEEYKKIGGDLVIQDGVVELIEMAGEELWLTALATSSDWHRAEDILEKLSLQLAFGITTTGEEVVNSKPDPEIYLLTVQKLAVEANECVVIEDTAAGVKAASRAGCVVVGLTSEYASGDSLKNAGAKYVVDNLREVVVLLASYAEKDK